MDRYNVNAAKSQIGFIDVIVQPTFEVLRSFLPNLSNYVENFNINKEKWKEKIPEYEEKLSIHFNFIFLLNYIQNLKIQPIYVLFLIGKINELKDAEQIPLSSNRMDSRDS
jgi:hypothetical protein